jgi:hypothetical protein
MGEVFVAGRGARKTPNPKSQNRRLCWEPKYLVDDGQKQVKRVSRF